MSQKSQNKKLRKAALEIIENRVNVLDAELSNSDDRYTTVVVDGVSYAIYMVGTDECFDLDEFYQYGITDDNRILKFYFDIPDDEDDLGALDYSHAYRVVDDTKSWDYTDLGDYLNSKGNFKSMLNDWLADHAVEYEADPLELEEPELNDGNWTCFAKDSRGDYELSDDGDGNIVINSLGHR